jgi:hypothetical protein
LKSSPFAAAKCGRSAVPLGPRANLTQSILRKKTFYFLARPRYEHFGAAGNASNIESVPYASGMAKRYENGSRSIRELIQSNPTFFHQELT